MISSSLDGVHKAMATSPLNPMQFPAPEPKKTSHCVTCDVKYAPSHSYRDAHEALGHRVTRDTDVDQLTRIREQSGFH